MRRSTSFVLVALLLAVARGPAADQLPDAFTLAMVRADGILVPFATFDGKRWKNGWPEPRPQGRSASVPIGLGDVPRKWWPSGEPVVGWTLWPLEGGEPQSLRAVSPCWFHAECTINVGLRSDYEPSSLPPPFEERLYPKIGMAVAGAVPVERVEVMSDVSPEWHRLTSVLAVPFQSAETQAIRDWMADGWTHPIAEADRQARSLSLEALYYVSVEPPDLSLYYFEASKRYDWPAWSEPADCELVTFAQGWIVSAGGQDRVSKIGASVVGCERKGLEYMLPLGVIRQQGAIRWIGQLSGWGYEHYVVVGFDKTFAPQALVDTPAGWCEEP